MRCLTTSGAPVLEVGVRPLEIDASFDLNLDDGTGPLAFGTIEDGFLDVIFEQLDIIFAHRGREQLAEICRRIQHVLWRENLAGVDDSADPYLIERVMRRMMVVFQQVLEIDRILQGSFAIGFAVDLYGLFDERQRRAGT